MDGIRLWLIDRLLFLILDLMLEKVEEKEFALICAIKFWYSEREQEARKEYLDGKQRHTI